MAIQPKNTNDIRVDIIGEKTGNAGVTIDGLLIKDSALGPDTVNFGTSLRGENNTFLRIRNAANSANLSVLKADGSDNVVLNAGTGKEIQFHINAVSKVKIDSSGNLVPSTTNTVSLGTTSLEYTNCFLRTLTRQSTGAMSVIAVDGDINMNADAAGKVIKFGTEGIYRWGIGNTTLVPQADNSYDIGTSSFRARDIFLGGSIKSVSGNLTIAPQTSGDVKIDLPGALAVEHVEIFNGGTRYWYIDSGGTPHWENNSGAANSTQTVSTQQGWIACSIGGATRYIPTYTAHS